MSTPQNQPTPSPSRQPLLTIIDSLKDFGTPPPVHLEALKLDTEALPDLAFEQALIGAVDAVGATGGAAAAFVQDIINKRVDLSENPRERINQLFQNGRDSLAILKMLLIGNRGELAESLLSKIHQDIICEGITRLSATEALVGEWLDTRERWRTETRFWANYLEHSNALQIKVHQLAQRFISRIAGIKRDAAEDFMDACVEALKAVVPENALPIRETYDVLNSEQFDIQVQRSLHQRVGLGVFSAEVSFSDQFNPLNLPNNAGISLAISELFRFAIEVQAGEMARLGMEADGPNTDESESNLLSYDPIDRCWLVLNALSAEVPSKDYARLIQNGANTILGHFNCKLVEAVKIKGN